jgi:hypothetical protein
LHWDEEPTEALNGLGGRASPVFALHTSVLERLPNTGIVAVLFARSPRELAATLQAKDPQRPHVHAFVTHGLASVVLISDDRDGVSTYVRGLTDALNAFELWPIADSEVSLQSIELWFGRGKFETPNTDQINANDLPLELSAEVRQFNANLALLVQTVRRFAPEMIDLTTFIRQAVERRVESLRATLPVSSNAASSRQLEQLHDNLANLVDINSCTVMLNSQLGGCLPPVINSDFPAGEFSLFGIGSMVRGAWRVYAHMASIFAAANHPQRFRQQFSRPAFDPGITHLEVDRSTWEHSAKTSSIDSVQLKGIEPPRRHIVYFSARWGFHETVNSITLSWQSLYFGATAQWTFLTFSHEFLHSHFRELIRSNVMDVRNREQLSLLVHDYNEAFLRHAAPSDFKRSLQFFLIRQIMAAEDAEQIARMLTVGAPGEAPLARVVSEGDLLRLMNGAMPDFIEEVLVHILDYHYFFDADDKPFVATMWSSWTFVPTVHRRLSHYLLRTLLALSSQARIADPANAFKDATGRVRACLQEMRNDAGNTNALILEADAALADAVILQQLWIRFRASYEVVLFANYFLIDRQIHGALIADEQAVPGTAPRYRLQTGEFPHQAIRSPTGFLLDRLVAQTTDAPVPFETLWELLLLVERDDPFGT